MSVPCPEPATEPLRVSVHLPGVEQLIAAHLARLLRTMPAGNPAVLCIGTDRSTGDALGPLVGSYLEGWRVGTQVWGTLDRPVHAANLPETMRELLAADVCPVIAVDACLGVPEQVGTIVVGKGYIRPGAGVNKDLPPVGDLHVTGTVNVAGYMEYMVLQNTRLSLVMKMARIAAAALALVLPTRPAVSSGVSCRGGGPAPRDTKGDRLMAAAGPGAPPLTPAEGICLPPL